MAQYINGVSLPKEEERSASGTSRTSDCNIAAIDFGTTHCSLAYSMDGKKSIQLLPLDNNGNYRVPSSILIDDDNNVKAFGYHARKVYSALSTDKKKNHYYFKELKMHLQHDETVSWTTTISAMNTTKFFLLEVISMILKYLKNQLLQGKFSHSMRGPMTASDFEWVITVPAMWRSRGKQMMREAAYKAGIGASENVEITCLTQVKLDPIDHKKLTTVPRKIVDTEYLHPEKLSLAHEPESAALYCMQQANEEANVSNSTFKEPDCYMILDIGGGTVDVSVHKNEPSGGVKVLIPPSGNDWGGTKINKEFKKFLEKVVDDEGFHRYLFSADKPDPKRTSKNSSDLDDLIYTKFEQQKRLYGSGALPSDEIVLSLPFTFMNTYSDDLQKAIRQYDIDLMEEELVIPTSRVDRFFSDAVNEIKQCVRNVLHTIDDKVKAVFFVGGFGGCKYLFDKLDEMIKQEYDTQCMTYRPQEHETAVVSGAVLFRQNPDIINCRVVDATYGTSCSMKFMPDHNPAYRFYDDDRVEHCNYLFAPFTLAGDVVRTNKVLVRTFVPVYHYQSSMVFTIYTSKMRRIHHVVSETGGEINDIKKIGELTVKMPNMTGDKTRKVKLFFDFSHTEIQIEAYDLTSACRATTTVDFLTDAVDIKSHVHRVT